MSAAIGGVEDRQCSKRKLSFQASVAVCEGSSPPLELGAHLDLGPCVAVFHSGVSARVILHNTCGVINRGAPFFFF